MKNFILMCCLSLTFSPKLLSSPSTEKSETSPYAQIFKIDVKKMNNETHWAPKEYKAKAGTKILFEVHHNLEGGPRFHGFAIPAFKVSKQINRGRVEKIEIDIPADFKPGQYDINCHFHAAHKGSKLVIEEAL